MKLPAALLSAALIAAPAFAQSPDVRVVIRPDLTHATPVRVAAAYAGVPQPVLVATTTALREAGFTVLSNEKRGAQEYVLVLKAQCRQDRQRTWRCTQYVARLVDRDSVDVRASAVLNPLVKPAKPLKKISEAVTVGWFVGGGA